jgi:serine/threonine-protein kinase
VALVSFATAAYLAIGKLLISKSVVSSPTVAASPRPTAFSPPAHSIAVLPFVNMSGDKEQEYFSDGITEELLNSLAEIDGLQVAARTSAFSFKGKDADIDTIARKLNVRAVLEGSVRRSGNTVRVTPQLIDAVTGFHLWSHTYDRDLGDVLKLETEIAHAVAGALKVSLLGDFSNKIEASGTRNAVAFDAYLRGRMAHGAIHGIPDFQTEIAAYTEAIALDQDYAAAYASRSMALSGYASEASGADIRESFDRSRADAEKAIALAPNLADGHLALAVYFEEGLLDFTQAEAEYARTLELAPGNARALIDYAFFSVSVGRTEAGLLAARHAVQLDPLSRNSHVNLAQALYLARHFEQALDAFQDALTLDPGVATMRGLAYYALGDFQSALAACQSKPDDWQSQVCLAVTYDKLGQHANAEAQLAKLRVPLGDAAAYQYASIHAQWGNRQKALEWLATAMRLRDAGLENLKTDPLMDPLRKEPRFQAMMRELKFPET